jgi:small GTP-binding protein
MTSAFPTLSGGDAHYGRAREGRTLDRYVRYAGRGYDLSNGRIDVQTEAQRQLDKLQTDRNLVINAKVIIIGPPSVGKTSLAVRFCDNTFVSNYKPTLGVDFLSKKYQVWGLETELNVWDTAGEERYKAVTHPFYRGAVACILCFDVNDAKSFEELPSWVTDVRGQNPDIHMFLVGNKSDLYNVIGQDKCEQYATNQRMEYFETSALQNTSVNNLFDRVTSVVVDDYLVQDYRSDIIVRMFFGCVGSLLRLIASVLWCC